MRDAAASLRVALASWLEARLYVAAAFIVTTAVVNRVEPTADFTPLQDGLLAWDGRWYEDIANRGYPAADHPAVRFFPLWPLVGRAAGHLPGLDAGTALVAIANIAALAAGVLLHRLTLNETGDREIARRATRLLAVAPPSFVLALAYSEALYIALAATVFVTAGRRSWWTAALAGYLAGLTRPVGVLLSLGVAQLARGQHRRASAIAATLAPIAGAATFLIWTQSALGDFTAPIDQQRELRGQVSEPVSRMVRAAWRGANGDSGELLHFLTALAVGALALVAVRRLSTPLALYAVPSVLLVLATENLNSIERYSLSAFPLLIAAAIVSKHRWLDRWLPAITGGAMICLTILALDGVYVP